jgi:hypothetical protein
MAEHQSEAPAENVGMMRSFTEQSERFSISISSESTLHSFPPDLHNAEVHSSSGELTPPAEFIERLFSPSTELPNLSDSTSLNGRPHIPNDSPPESENGELTNSRPTTIATLKRKMWNPVWLTSSVLLGFALTFVGLFVLVLALYLCSKRYQGLLCV